MDRKCTEEEIQELVDEITEDCYDRDELLGAMFDFLQFELDIPFTFDYLGRKWKAENIDFYIDRIKIVQIVNNREYLIEFTDITIEKEYTKNIKLQKAYILFLKEYF